MVRNGLRGRTQRYKCKDCGRRFDGGIRRDKSGILFSFQEFQLVSDTNRLISFVLLFDLEILQ